MESVCGLAGGMDVDGDLDFPLDLDDDFDSGLALALAMAWAKALRLAFFVLDGWLGGGRIMARSCKNDRFRKNLP